VRYGKLLGIEKIFLSELAETVVKIYEEVYPEVKAKQNFIKEKVKEEEEKFRVTLEKGLKEFKKQATDNKISGREAFILFSTYGFPFELIRELAGEAGYEVNESEFKEEMREHQKLSRTAAAGQFKGGLADASEETKRLHTTAHLMLEAMRRVLGEQVEQRGSNITAERLRFDFSYPEKLTGEQKDRIEKIVNEAIDADMPVEGREMNRGEARRIRATGIFESKYGEKVKVYFVGEGNFETGDGFFSREICGGPHIRRTGEIKGEEEDGSGRGKFKIIKEESAGAGVRRIRAVIVHTKTR